MASQEGGDLPIFDITVDQDLFLAAVKMEVEEEHMVQSGLPTVPFVKKEPVMEKEPAVNVARGVRSFEEVLLDLSAVKIETHEEQPWEQIDPLLLPKDEVKKEVQEGVLTNKTHSTRVKESPNGVRVGANQHAPSNNAERPHACSICRKQFTLPRNLKRHMLIHTGEKPYVCSICGKQFRKLSHVKLHKLTHKGEKPHACSICGKQFARRFDFKVHKRIHTGEKPHACFICGKQYTQHSGLKVHKRAHTGEKPYGCYTCNKRFSWKGALKQHVLIHTGEKPHTCFICSRQFTRCSNLKRHLLIHTCEKP